MFNFFICICIVYLTKTKEKSILSPITKSFSYFSRCWEKTSYKSYCVYILAKCRTISQMLICPLKILKLNENKRQSKRIIGMAKTDRNKQHSTYTYTSLDMIYTRLRIIYIDCFAFRWRVLVIDLFLFSKNALCCVG